MASLNVKLKPFSIPNFVLIIDERRGTRQDGFNGFNQSQSIPLKDVPKEVLIEMCEEFKNNILAKAGYNGEEDRFKND